MSKIIELYGDDLHKLFSLNYHKEDCSELQIKLSNQFKSDNFDKEKLDESLELLEKVLDSYNISFHSKTKILDWYYQIIKKFLFIKAET